MNTIAIPADAHRTGGETYPPCGLVPDDPVRYWWVVDGEWVCDCGLRHEATASSTHRCGDEIRMVLRDARPLTPPADLLALTEPCETCTGRCAACGRQTSDYDPDVWHGCTFCEDEPCPDCHDGKRLIEARQTCPHCEGWPCMDAYCNRPDCCPDCGHEGEGVHGVGTLELGRATATFVGAANPSPPGSTRTDVVVPVLRGYFAWQSPWKDMNLEPGQFVACWTESQG